jgi:hypothetical protein
MRSMIPSLNANVPTNSPAGAPRKDAESAVSAQPPHEQIILLTRQRPPGNSDRAPAIINPRIEGERLTRPDIGIAVLHGIGSQQPDFADSFIELLCAELSRTGHDPEKFAFQPVHWAEVLAPAERKLLASAYEGGPMDWNPVRLFVFEALADAVAYRRGHPKGWDAYHQIHWEVYRQLAILRDRLSDPAAPLIIIAHSLGSVIMSDHIWDEQKGEGFGRNAFTRCETLAGIITMGSTIPLFTLGLTEVRCIQFPPPSLPADMRAAARWQNYYDRDDVLGYPLRTLSKSYAETVEADVELNAGNAVTSWNPMSHNGYWTEPEFVRRAGEQVERIYDLRSRIEDL